MQTVQYTLPSHWACAFINGDDSGYEDCEIEQINAFEKFLNYMYGKAYCIDVEEDSWFTSSHDVSDEGVLACEVSVFTFDVGH